MNKLSVEDFAQTFELNNEPKIPTARCEPVTIWLPIEHKAKYDLIQAKSNHKFGKFLREIIKKSIDSVVIEKKAS